VLPRKITGAATKCPGNMNRALPFDVTDQLTHILAGSGGGKNCSGRFLVAIVYGFCLVSTADSTWKIKQ